MKGLVGVAVLGVALVATACTTTGEIDGHKIRGTAPMADADPVQEAAREFWDDIGKTVAEAYGTTPEEMRRGHYSDDPSVQAAVEKLLAKRAAHENPADLHANAPQWFKDGWKRYLNDANGQYAVLAIDRNARGWGYVYCRAADCHRLQGAQHKSHKDLRYKHQSLELCRENVREYYPAHRPDCAIYAVENKIVWEGPMPWE